MRLSTEILIYEATVLNHNESSFEDQSANPLLAIIIN